MRREGRRSATQFMPFEGTATALLNNKEDGPTRLNPNAKRLLNSGSANDSLRQDLHQLRRANYRSVSLDSGQMQLSLQQVDRAQRGRREHEG